MTHTPDGFLTEQLVRQTYDAVYADRSVTFETAEVVGWILQHTMSIRRLQLNRENIIKMLLCLQEGFRRDTRGGGSVAAMIYRNDGTIWTQDMAAVERLVALGVGVGLMSFNVPDRSKWPKLPGGLPYVRVEITATGVTIN